MPNEYAATNTKKFLDADGLTYFSRKLNNYPTNEVIEAVVDGVQDALDEKLNNVLLVLLSPSIIRHEIVSELPIGVPSVLFIVARPWNVTRMLRIRDAPE